MLLILLKRGKHEEEFVWVGVAGLFLLNTQAAEKVRWLRMFTFRSEDVDVVACSLAEAAIR